MRRNTYYDDFLNAARGVLTEQDDPADVLLDDHDSPQTTLQCKLDSDLYEGAGILTFKVMTDLSQRDIEAWCQREAPTCGLEVETVQDSGNGQVIVRAKIRKQGGRVTDFTSMMQRDLGNVDGNIGFIPETTTADLGPHLRPQDTEAGQWWDSMAVEQKLRVHYDIIGKPWENENYLSEPSLLRYADLDPAFREEMEEYYYEVVRPGLNEWNDDNDYEDGLAYEDHNSDFYRDMKLVTGQIIECPTCKGDAVYQTSESGSKGHYCTHCNSLVIYSDPLSESQLQITHADDELEAYGITDQHELVGSDGDGYMEELVAHVYSLDRAVEIVRAVNGDPDYEPPERFIPIRNAAAFSESIHEGPAVPETPWSIFEKQTFLEHYPEADNMWMDLAWKLPPELVYMAAIRLGAYATTGQYGETVVPELRFMDALKRWETFTEQDGVGIEISDRYSALGIERPDPATVCGGHCEGTGFVPIDGRAFVPPLYTVPLPKGHCRHRDYDEAEYDCFREPWLQAERENPTDDGWHFVKCPDCGGTGKIEGAGSVWEADAVTMVASIKLNQATQDKLETWLRQVQNEYGLEVVSVEPGEGTTTVDVVVKTTDPDRMDHMITRMQSLRLGNLITSERESKASAGLARLLSRAEGRARDEARRAADAASERPGEILGDLGIYIDAQEKIIRKARQLGDRNNSIYVYASAFLKELKRLGYYDGDVLEATMKEADKRKFTSVVLDENSDLASVRSQIHEAIGQKSKVLIRIAHPAMKRVAEQYKGQDGVQIVEGTIQPGGVINEVERHPAYGVYFRFPDGGYEDALVTQDFEKAKRTADRGAGGGNVGVVVGLPFEGTSISYRLPRGVDPTKQFPVVYSTGRPRMESTGRSGYAVEVEQRQTAAAWTQEAIQHKAVVIDSAFDGTSLSLAFPTEQAARDYMRVKEAQGVTVKGPTMQSFTESIDEAERYELFYSTGGHGGPYHSLDDAREWAIKLLRGNPNERYIEIRDSSFRNVIQKIDRSMIESINEGLVDTIRAGDRVTILTPQGQERTGRAVMRGPAGWVLNMGGRHGTPGLATDDNVIKVSPARHKDTPTGALIRGMGRESVDEARQYYELQQSDVGKPHLRIFGRVWPVSSFMGRILPQDVGKRVYLVGDILQVENDAQRARRLGEAIGEAAKGELLWMRLGDGGEYHHHDQDMDSAADHVAELFGWQVKGGDWSVQELMDTIRWQELGLQIGTMTGHNYVSLYWGDENADSIRGLDRKEQTAFVKALRSALKEYEK